MIGIGYMWTKFIEEPIWLLFLCPYQHIIRMFDENVLSILATEWTN